MKILRNRQKVERFWQALSDDRLQRLIMLDYDGTLSPFVADREKAFPYPGISRILRDLIRCERNTVVIVSGRSAAEVERLLGLDVPVEIWGGHGTEHLLPSGVLVQVPVPEASERIFHRVEEWADREGLGSNIEEKHGSLALHVRGMEKDEAQRVLRQATRFFQRVSEDSMLEVDPFDGGVELRTRGIDKGVVVRRLVRTFPMEGLCSYYGDDLTDEDAFSALDGRGVSFLVRKEFRQTAADVWIVPPRELKDCLLKYVE